MATIRVSGYLDDGINSRDERLPSTQQHRNGRLTKVGGGANQMDHTSGRRRGDDKHQSRQYTNIASPGYQHVQQSRRIVDRNQQDTDEQHYAGTTRSLTCDEMPIRDIMEPSPAYGVMIRLNSQDDKSRMNNEQQEEIEDEEDCTCCDIHSSTRREPFCNEGAKNLCTLAIWAALTIVVIHRFLVHMSIFLHSRGASANVEVKNAHRDV